MKEILNYLYSYQTLDRQTAETTLLKIARAEYPASQVAAFLGVFNMRPVTPAEILGFRDAMLNLSLPVQLGSDRLTDVCGTGGDGKNTFNISTLTAFVLAGAGINVSKHGNYGMSSVCGSSNVMEVFGYRFTNDTSFLNRELEKAGICFLHAPLFHPAMKHIAPVRRELGVKTFFNMLGPLINPARPSYQMAGVFNPETARLYQYAMENTTSNYCIVHSIDGYDEISLTGKFRLTGKNSSMQLSPADLGFENVNPGEITGGETINQSAGVFKRILEDDATAAQKNVVLANSAVALSCVYPEKSLGECLVLARESLESKKALKAFSALLAINNSHLL